MPKLVFHDSDGIDRTIDLGSEPTLIGRATECQVNTQDAMVSRRHARIVWEGGYFIEDLGSSNGVYVAGERVQKAALRPGDEVRCGSLVMKLIVDVPARPSSNSGRVAPIGASRGPGSARMPTIQPPPPPAQNFGAPPPYEAPMAPPPEELSAPPPYEPPPSYEAPRGDSGSMPPAARRSPSAPRAIVNAGDADSERQRREQAEAAVLTAEQRAASAEGRLFEFEQQVTELTARVTVAESAARVATDRSTQLETSARDGEKFRRQVEQLKADLRRLRGGSSEDTNATGGTDPTELMALIAERDRLKQRVTDLEAEVGRLEGGNTSPVAAAGDATEVPLLKRKIDQLNTELRRLRGGQPAPPDNSDQIADLQMRLTQAEHDRDEALHRAAADVAAAQSSAAPAEDVGKLKRMLEQLTAENRRLRQGAPPPAEDPRIADLTARLAQAEQERDAAKRTSSKNLGPAVTPATVVDAASGLNDALSDLRGSLRAASDEIGVLGVEAPGDSVTVLKDAIVAANDQLETARGALKDLKRALNIN